MAACYNPMNIEKKTDVIFLKNKNMESINNFIKDFLSNYDLPKDIHDIQDNKVINNNELKKYLDNIINFINTNEESRIGKVYWDIEAQKFLIE
jgi:hypothetical protein